MQSQTKGSRRVKIGRGESWIVRFLPAQMGPDKMFYARIARHWLNKLPIICPRNTSEDYGGNPNENCPVCELAENLNDSTDKDISSFGYKAMASAQFLTYCAVFEKNGVEQPMSEVLIPYEFWHYRNTWEELKGFYLAGGRRSPDSVLDYITGNDFSVIKAAKGMRLDKLDSGPIFDPESPKFKDYIAKLESGIRTPKVAIPTNKELTVFAAKLQEAANRGSFDGGRDGDRRRGRYDDDRSERVDRGDSRDSEHEDSDDGIPQRRGSASARSFRQEEPLPRAGRRINDNDDGDLGPVSRGRQAAEQQEEPPRSPRRQAAPEPEPEQETPVQNQRAAAQTAPPARGRREASAPEETQSRPSRRPAESIEEAPRPPRNARGSAPAPAPAPEPETEADSGAEPEEAPTSSARGSVPARRRGTAPAPEVGESDEDNLPPDDRDPVPPAKAPDVDEAPPATRRGGSTAEAISSRISKLRADA